MSGIDPPRPRGAATPPEEGTFKIIIIARQSPKSLDPLFPICYNYPQDDVG
ncbi:MAG: hypothetical protein PHE24_06430 [Patescibacteria group bacterium]|nr:hypothetical protein [Patescibacteria group bacterium]